MTPAFSENKKSATGTMAIMNPIKTVTSFLVLALCITGAATAGDLSGPAGFVDLHYYKYTEPGTMNEKSRAPGFTVGWRDESAIRTEAGFGAISGNLELALGLTKYDGSGTRDTSYYKILGEIYTPLYKSVYAGLGYRRLFDNLGPGNTSTGAGGYDRLSQYFYVPVGVITKFSTGDSFKTQYNWFLRGKQISYLTQVSGYGNDPENTQKSGYGLDFAYTPAKGGWELYFRYWRIKDSDSVNIYRTNGTLYGTGTEPLNNTKELGVRFAF